jgi:RimJ/RimL family protein N-acetyltransferase
MTLDELPDIWRAPPRLQGRHVTLEPLDAAHADGLREALAGDGLSRAWYTSVPTAAGVERWLDTALQAHAQGRALPFAVRDASGVVVGSTRFYHLEPGVPRLSIGYTWYTPRVQRTGVNTEAKRLLLTHAFEALDCLSVMFETSWFNHASRTAIARLGARQDGVLRNHLRHADGTPRDTVVFSIIDSEWPAVKRHLAHRLEQGGRGDGA